MPDQLKPHPRVSSGKSSHALAVLLRASGPGAASLCCFLAARDGRSPVLRAGGPACRPRPVTLPTDRLWSCAALHLSFTCAVKSRTPAGAVSRDGRGGLFPTLPGTDAESVPGCLCAVALVGQAPGLRSGLDTWRPASGQSSPVRKG